MVVGVGGGRRVGRGYIVFHADHVWIGVGIHVGIASCLLSISSLKYEVMDGF